MTAPDLGSTDAANAAALALRCLDLTSLRDTDDEASTEALAQRALEGPGPPAALCVLPRWVPRARQALNAQGGAAVRVATVVNFPAGTAAPSIVAAEIDAALTAGADEIDAVLPWHALQAGQLADVLGLVRRCRAACAAVPLKLILETGELQQPALIRLACVIGIDEGVDFLKTSTGRARCHATPAAVALMLKAIAEARGRVGLKVAGGLASLADVQTYLALARQACGATWLRPQHLRFGASGLLPVLRAALQGQPADAADPAAY